MNIKYTRLESGNHEIVIEEDGRRYVDQFENLNHMAEWAVNVLVAYFGYGFSIADADVDLAITKGQVTRENYCYCESSKCHHHNDGETCTSTRNLKSTTELGTVCEPCRNNYALAGYPLTTVYPNGVNEQ